MRGQGLGTVLLEEQLRMARDAGFRRAVLDVAVTNSRAQLLYERLGFRVTGERSVKTRGSAIDVPQQRRMELLL
jgi:ribosomal protein S18 acetylase RimI-like enzyme